MVGLPGPPVVVPGIADAFWLDPTAHVFLVIAIQGSTPITGAVAVPATASFLGARLHWQALSHGPVTGLQATNPVVTVVR